MLRLAVLLLSTVAFVGVSTGVEAATKAKKRVVMKAKPITKAPPKPASAGSLGLHVGIIGGYDWGRATFSDAAGSTGIRVPSGLLGFTFGYNAQSGALVYGLETDIAAAWLKNTNWGAPPCFACEVGLTYFGTLRGRLGYAVGQSLPYVTGGLAYGGVKTGLAGGGSQTDAQAGWTVGGGIEYALVGAWSVKTEYLYFELGRTTCATGICGSEVGVKFRGSMLRVGSNFRF